MPLRLSGGVGIISVKYISFCLLFAPEESLPESAPDLTSYRLWAYSTWNLEETTKGIKFQLPGDQSVFAFGESRRSWEIREQLETGERELEEKEV